MKDNVEIYTLALIRVIRDSDDYKAFEAAKRKVAADPALKTQIDDYRKACYLLQNTGDDATLYDRTRDFYEQYKEFRQNPLVEQYLSAELAVCRMLQHIATRVVEEVDLDLERLAGEIHR